jgi:hypothetical protein
LAWPVRTIPSCPPLNCPRCNSMPTL